MPVKLIAEEDLRAALRPDQVDANGFEAGIRARIEAGEERFKLQESQSPLLRVAAAILPWPLMSGGKIVGGGTKLSSVAFGQKLLGYAALPAISLFLLVGAAMFSAMKIRGVQKENHPDTGDPKEIQSAVRQWWSRYKWCAWLVWAAVLILPMIGSTWLLFLLLLISFASLLCFLSGFAKLGVGNRLVISQSCFMGLVFLGQSMVNAGVGKRDIHFVDQKLIAVVLYIGSLILLPFVISGMKRMRIFGAPLASNEQEMPSKSRLLLGVTLLLFVIGNALIVWSLFKFPENHLSSAVGTFRWLLLATPVLVSLAALVVLAVGRFRKAVASRLLAGRRWLAAERQWIGGLVFCSCIVPMILWFTNQIWCPPTPSRIKSHVESFEEGPYPRIAWRDWEIAASWTIETGLDPDLTRARELLEDEIDHQPSGNQFTRVLGSAFRVGLVRTDQIEEFEQITDLKKFRQVLIPKTRTRKSFPITSLDQRAWVFYALDQSGQLSPEDRDFLEQRLLATLDDLDGKTGDVLRTALRVTQLLRVIDRPIDRDQYRERVHQWLCRFHRKKTSYFQLEGGFQKYEGLASSMQVTSDAVELMTIYGIPDDLEMNWVRSYLRPLYSRSANEKWIAAVTLNRLNALPDATHPTWLEILYYERSLIAAMVLVVLCLYATLSSPVGAIARDFCVELSEDVTD